MVGEVVEIVEEWEQASLAFIQDGIGLTLDFTVCLMVRVTIRETSAPIDTRATESRQHSIIG